MSYSFQLHITIHKPADERHERDGWREVFFRRDKSVSALIFNVHSLAVPSKAAAESLLMVVGIKIVINSFYLTSCSWMSLMLYRHCFHLFSPNCLQLKLISAFFPCQVYFIVVCIVAGKNSCFTLCLSLWDDVNRSQVCLVVRQTTTAKASKFYSCCCVFWKTSVTSCGAKLLSSQTLVTRI